MDRSYLELGDASPDTEKFWSIIANEALPVLIRCVQNNYLFQDDMEDLEIVFSSKRKGSVSHGNGKIIFGPFNMGSEYAMYKDDTDLRALNKWGTGRISEYLEFKAWWLAAHELAHEVVDRVRKLCTEIYEPIIPNLFNKLAVPYDLEGAYLQMHYQTLQDLVVNQAWWIECPLKQKAYQLDYLPEKAFKHGVFYQHIYRTLRREVVNPKFGIPVGDWKQKSKPKKDPRANGRSRIGRQYYRRPVMTATEWEKVVDAAAKAKKRKDDYYDELRLKRLQKEREETQRRESIMRDNNDTPPSSLIEKIKSQVHDEQIQLAKDLIEREIVPLIQLAIKEDLDYIDIRSHQLIDWGLIGGGGNEEEVSLHLPTYFQKFEYMLLDENLKLKWFAKDGDEWDELYVDRSTEEFKIRTIKSSIILEISW